MSLLTYLTLLLALFLSAGEEHKTSDYYPIAHLNEWRYNAPEGWHEGDYISSIVKDELDFERYYKVSSTIEKQHKSYYGALWDENRSYLHYDATKAAKLLHVNGNGIYYVGELFSGDDSFVLFDNPIHWFAENSKVGDTLEESRNYTRFYKDGASDEGVFRITQTISKNERVNAVSTSFQDCLRVEFDTFWQLSETSQAISENVYHYAKHVGVVKADARFIILNNGKEVINRLIQTKLKDFMLNPQDDEQLSATDIMEAAHHHAGGKFWSRPQTLSLTGHGYFYKDGKTHFHENHKMYRVFENEKTDAHQANGKVRIESYRSGSPIIMVTFDGQNTYDLSGKRPQSAADKQWASSFGFGVIRHALDEGYRLERLPNDKVDGSDAFMVKVIDPNEGETIFGIAQSDYKIVKVAFQTPRGWHERIYSEFFTKEGLDWQQSGHVRLFYNGIKSNEIIWTDFDVNANLPDSLFRL